MICHVVCVEIEKALEQAGVPNNKNHRIIDYFPPYRLKKDIDKINEYLGISVTRIIILEHVTNPAKKTVLSKIDDLYFLLDKLGVNKKSWLYSLIDSLECKVYEIGNKYRRCTTGYRKLTGYGSNKRCNYR